MAVSHIPAGLFGDKRDAYVALNSLLSSWGLGSLAGQVLGFVQQGYSQQSITYLLQQTPEYQKRFAGNALRIKNGLAPLSPAEYLSNEKGYTQALRIAGTPKSFYDKPDDFTNWIGADVSPAEVARRASDAASFVNQTDPNYRQWLASSYGITSQHLVAHFLDQKVAEPILQKQIDSAMVGGAALDHGLAATSKPQAERFTDMGITAAQAQQGYAGIASMLPDEQAIAQRFGQSYSQVDAENEVFGGAASAARKRRQLNNREESLFSGDNAVRGGSLAPSGEGTY